MNNTLKNNHHCTLKHLTNIFIRWSSYRFYVWNTNDVLICFSYGLNCQKSIIEGAYWTPPNLNKTLNNRLEWKRGSMFVRFRFLERIVRIRYPMQSIWKKKFHQSRVSVFIGFSLSLFQKSLGTLKIALPKLILRSIRGTTWGEAHNLCDAKHLEIWISLLQNEMHL